MTPHVNIMAICPARLAHCPAPGLPVDWPLVEGAIAVHDWAGDFEVLQLPEKPFME